MCFCVVFRDIMLSHEMWWSCGGRGVFQTVKILPTQNTHKKKTHTHTHTRARAHTHKHKLRSDKSNIFTYAQQLEITAIATDKPQFRNPKNKTFAERSSKCSPSFRFKKRTVVSAPFFLFSQDWDWLKRVQLHCICSRERVTQHSVF